MAAGGRLAATLLLAIFIGCARQAQGEAPGDKKYNCYNGDMGKDGKKVSAEKTCQGSLCKLEINYEGMKLSDIKSVDGSCLEIGETGCWKYQSQHKAVCHCKMSECNSKEHQDRALRQAINDAGPSSDGAWVLVGGAALLYAIYHN
ncbi:hypothetical protein PRIPAC_87106 [Pristionchus pacificus]|uniref:Uncharacterized protein n=1 Tax=Pristionchus pacificus TaxID=54126 RepID=A0A2A6CWF1_PRIPA|nr:hypothetical protein PRIPAC_87106 [Pristionchus pacificus]|eukprot:PDM82552.1 hypothetical protein PRIPAC_36945 [Pristionchus pacificus]